MNTVSEKISNVLWEQGILKKDDKNICSYGLDILISSVAEVTAILIISLLVNNFRETAVFFAAFIPLRIFAGGYHAKTRMRCFFVSLAVYAVFSVVVRTIPAGKYSLLSIITAPISLAIVLAFAPVVHKNKSASENERKIYRDKSIRICLAESAVIFLAVYIFKSSRFAVSAALGQLAVTLSMLAAVIKNEFDNK